MKKILFGTTLLTFLLLGVGGKTSLVLANDELVDNTIDTTAIQIDEKQPEVFQDDFKNEQELNSYVTSLLQDPNVEGVSVVDKGLKSNLARSNWPDYQWRPIGKGRYLAPWGFNANTYGSIINSVAGDPGTTIGLNYSRSVSASVNSTLGVEAGPLNLAVGFNVSGSYKVSFTGSYKVENTVNGRKVKRLTLTARPVYMNKKFVLKRIDGVKVNSVAKKPVGIYYAKSYTF